LTIAGVVCRFDIQFGNKNYMFDIHVGDTVSGNPVLIPSVEFGKGVLLTGRPGQGKSTVFLQIALAAIRNKQRGVILDPYGDLANDLHARIGVKIFDIDDVTEKDLARALAAGEMFVVYTRQLSDGERVTREKGCAFLKMVYKHLKRGDWLMIDEAFAFIDDELWRLYLQSGVMGLHFLFCEIRISRLSEDEREALLKMVQNYIVYKIQNFDALCLAKWRPEFDPKKIAAVKQYHFLMSLDDGGGSGRQGGGARYLKGVWPIS
jgi:energy-coupling factor transporter ATP-binding protein EcfA2